MSKLITVHDFSPSRDFTASFLNGAVRPSPDSSVALGPFNSLACEIEPTHAHLWAFRTDKLPFPANIAAQWDKIASNLDAGRDVVIHTYAVSRPWHDFFHTQFLNRIDQAKHTLESLIIVGSPILLFEQFYRHPGAKVADADAETYMSRLLDIPILIETLRERYGENAVKLIPNFASSAVGTPDVRILNEIAMRIGLPAPAAPSLTMANSAYRSHLSRRLRAATEVRDNSWPHIDPEAIRDALNKTDATLPEDICSPLALRQKFVESSGFAARELERLLNIETGALDAPEYLRVGEAVQSPEILPRDAIATFLDNLDKESRTRLRERLVNDEVLLTPDQKAILAFMNERGGYRVIGEPEPPVELTVLTMTYNHEKYIAQCMDSVLAQRTDFPVRHIVLDHHSEDGTPRIVAEYAARHPTIRPVLLSHRRSQENVRGLFARCRTRYAALCDGDDYFTSPDKLRKQVDFLEKNPDHALCFHPVMAVFEDGRKPTIYPPLDTLPRHKSGAIFLSDLVQTNFIQTNSVVYRWRFRDGLPAWFRSDLCPGDWYWHLLHAETGKIGFIPEVMSAYRRHAGALYAQTLVSRRDHRRKLGMPELATYQAVDDHFNKRYHRPLSTLASSVFADFVELMMEEDEPRLLNWAVEKYPDFARDFLNSLSALEEKQKAEGLGGKENGRQ
ncbi:MAG: glycosyltransferase [Desulfovibrio sp.]|nr:glycosyltransferase [Desulfovibrio sp.]